jgi:ferric-dicitrate binding protein FerR (iron transport regulator)
MKRTHKNVKEVLESSWPSASEEEMQRALGRISNRLWSNRIDEILDPRLASRLDENLMHAPIRRRSGWGAAAAIAAAIAIAVLVPARVIRSAPAVLEDSAGSRQIQYGEIVSPRGGEGGTLKLTNGSSLEMRSETELSVERVDDSLRIHIHNGDVIVNSAEPLLVETKDISASGKVFLVNAKEEGSRVAVIQGETRIQQGPTGKTLLPGEQVATSREMESLPMKEGMGWSRKAEVQLALLQLPGSSNRLF